MVPMSISCGWSQDDCQDRGQWWKPREGETNGLQELSIRVSELPTSAPRTILFNVVYK